MQAGLMVATSVQHTNVLHKNNMKENPAQYGLDCTILVLMFVVELATILCVFYAVFG